MAALMEGQQYGLSSQGHHSKNKSLVFVKLTDSALKAIEEFVKTKANSSLKPSIQFQSNNGVISLPKNNSNGYKTQSYGFTLSNVEAEGPQGSFECLRQNGSRSLESLGGMLLKMHIHANEDSYEKTRVKMAAVEKENKKFCTKEIKPSGPYLGRKVKVKRPLSSVPPPKPSSPPLLTLSKPLTKPLTYGNGNLITANQANSVNTSRQVPMNKNNKTTEVMKKSLRDRIIHLLALRPYKKPELLARLLKDGIKDREKKGISLILTQTAVLKDNSFNIANHAWSEVHDNWPFYSSDEVELVKKRRRQFASVQNENGVLSPSSAFPSHSPIQKRSLTEYEIPVNKRQRISHYNKVENSSSNSNSGFPANKQELSSAAMSDKHEDNFHHSSRNEHLHGKLRANCNGNILEHSIQKSPTNVNGAIISNGINSNHSQKNFVNNETEKNHILTSSNLSQRSYLNGEHEKLNHPSSLSSGQKSHGHNEVDKLNCNVMSQKNPNYEVEKLNQPHSVGGIPKSSFPNNEIEKSNFHSHTSFTVFQKGHENENLHVNNVQKTNFTSEAKKQNLHLPSLPNARAELMMRPADSSQTLNNVILSPDTNNHFQGTPKFEQFGDKTVGNGYGHKRNQNSGMENAHHRKNWPKVSSTTNSSGSSPRTSPDSRDSMDYNDSEPQELFPASSTPDFPEYLKRYGVIASVDQRARYKADFNAQYEEYRFLHSKMRKVSKRFAALEDQLNALEEGSEEWHEVKSRIYREYEDNKHDPMYQNVRRKFNFLHNKLSHIKRLVMEYDSVQAVKS